MLIKMVINGIIQFVLISLMLGSGVTSANKKSREECIEGMYTRFCQHNITCGQQEFINIESADYIYEKSCMCAVRNSTCPQGCSRPEVCFKRFHGEHMSRLKSQCNNQHDCVITTSFRSRSSCEHMNNIDSRITYRCIVDQTSSNVTTTILLSDKRPTKPHQATISTTIPLSGKMTNNHVTMLWAMYTRSPGSNNNHFSNKFGSPVHSESDTGSIVGGVIGCLVIVVILVISACLLKRRKALKTNSHEYINPTSANTDPSPRYVLNEITSKSILTSPNRHDTIGRYCEPVYTNTTTECSDDNNEHTLSTNQSTEANIAHSIFDSDAEPYYFDLEKEYQDLDFEGGPVAVATSGNYEHIAADNSNISNPFMGEYNHINDGTDGDDNYHHLSTTSYIQDHGVDYNHIGEDIPCDIYNHVRIHNCNESTIHDNYYNNVDILMDESIPPKTMTSMSDTPQ